MRRTARQRARRAPSARRTPQASCWHGTWAGPFGRGTQISGRGPRTQARHGRVLQSPIGKHSRAYDRLESDVRSARRTCPIPTPTHPLRSSCLSTGHAAHEWLGLYNYSNIETEGRGMAEVDDIGQRKPLLTVEEQIEHSGQRASRSSCAPKKTPPNTSPSGPTSSRSPRTAPSSTSASAGRTTASTPTSTSDT